MKTRISESMRRQVAERAEYRCEYCLIPEKFLASIFHVDHIRSQKHKGKTILTNLAYGLFPIISLYFISKFIKKISTKFNLERSAKSILSNVNQLHVPTQQRLLGSDVR